MRAYYDIWLNSEDRNQDTHKAPRNAYQTPYNIGMYNHWTDFFGCIHVRVSDCIKRLGEVPRQVHYDYQ